MNSIVRGSIAEFVGTFALTFVGAGAIILCNGQDLMLIALAHGFILAVMVSAVMHVSGAQFNPAVSISLCMLGKQTWRTAGVFIVVQCIASIAAAGLLLAALNSLYEEQIQSVRLGATLGHFSVGSSPSIMLVAALEMIATFFLMFVILGTVVDGRGVGKSVAIGGFGIGFVVAANILFFGPLTGASMNPARSIGPALVGGHWEMHWVYWVAPIVGALAASAIWRMCIGLGDDDVTA